MKPKEIPRRWRRWCSWSEWVQLQEQTDSGLSFSQSPLYISPENTPFKYTFVLNPNLSQNPNPIVSLVCSNSACFWKRAVCSFSSSVNEQWGGVWTELKSWADSRQWLSLEERKESRPLHTELLLNRTDLFWTAVSFSSVKSNVDVEKARGFLSMARPFLLSCFTDEWLKIEILELLKLN